MCSEYISGGYDHPRPPKDDPWYYKILDALIWVLVLLYKPWKYRKKIGAFLLIPAMLVTWPWWGYRYYKKVISP